MAAHEAQHIVHAVCSAAGLQFLATKPGVRAQDHPHLQPLRADLPNDPFQFRAAPENEQTRYDGQEKLKNSSFMLKRNVFW
jgi:hypothetical protein